MLINESVHLPILCCCNVMACGVWLSNGVWVIVVLASLAFVLVVLEVVLVNSTGSLVFVLVEVLVNSTDITLLDICEGDDDNAGGLDDVNDSDDDGDIDSNEYADVRAVISVDTIHKVVDGDTNITG